ncbi:MAG: hypothetical protein ACTSUG_02180 [Candidatus Helarchaeota archaeon]
MNLPSTHPRIPCHEISLQDPGHGLLFNDERERETLDFAQLFLHV